MTQYLLSVHNADDFTPPPAAEMQAMFAAVDAVNEKLREAGAWVFAGGLEPADTATVVRLAGDDPVLSDGPYLESKEHIGGFWVIEAPDLDAALDWAKQGARACRGPVEVRPFQSTPEVAAS